MTSNEFREQLNQFRRRVHTEAEEQRDSYYALDELRRLFEQFSDVERHMANEVVAEWVSSDEENVRFDGLWLALEFRITEATAALEELRRRLRVSVAVSAPYELESVERVLRTLRPDGLL